MKTKLKLFYALIPLLAILAILVSVSSASAFEPSGKDYVPYTENYNVRFNSDGDIDYDLLIAKIMPKIFEKKLLNDYQVDIGSQDIVLNRGVQLSIYQEHSYNCGYVIDYTDNTVYWLEAAINSTDIQYVKIFTETPKPDFGDIPEEDHILMANFTWCFSPLEKQVAAIFLEEKSYLTETEEGMVAFAVRHDLRGNPNLGHQDITVGKFNFDTGENVLNFCGEFKKPFRGLGFFGGSLFNGALIDFHLDNSLSPLCAISDDAKVYPVQFTDKEYDPKLEVWENLRMETVHLKSSSVEKLLERNYMIVKPVHNMILEYSTSLNIEFVTYNRDDSSTIFEINPYHDDTFVKIRVPQNGGNYYMSYGPNEWNKGDLTSVVILVNGIEVDYKSQLFIQSPNAPYPQYYTDYIFEFPAKSDIFNVILFIENYEPDSDHSDNEWNGYKPNHN